MRPSRPVSPFPVAAILAAVLLFSSLPSAETPEQKDPRQAERESAQKELLEVRARMDREKKVLSTIMKKQGNLLEKLEALKSQLARSKKRLDRLTREQEIAARESEDLEAAIRELDHKLDRKRAVMNKRIRARYRFGSRSLLRVWIEAENFADFSRRRKYLDTIFLADLKRITDYRELMAEWLLARERLSEKQASLASLEKILEEQRQELDAERLSLTGLLRAIKEERSTHEAMLAELKSSAARLQGLIADLDRRERHPGEDDETGAGFEERRGALCFPASGPVLSGFGKKVHPRFNTVTMRNGIEIGASPGAPARAVYQGMVRFAEWFRGYGNLVIVDHENGYYTIYAHLAEIRAGVGERVDRGSVVGTVGDTGSMQGPSLYFELRHHQQPLDPEPWLGGCSL